MNKQEAIEQKKYREQVIACISASVAELDAIINAPEPDPRIGKLFWFWDNNINEKVIGTFASEDASESLRYERHNGAAWKHCRPVTLADLEGKIYQEPRKSRYDWSRKDIPTWVKYWATDADGQESWFEYLPKKATVCWLYPGDGRVRCAKTASIYCPDWRDSLEERPEGV